MYYFIGRVDTLWDLYWSVWIWACTGLANVILLLLYLYVFHITYSLHITHSLYITYPLTINKVALLAKIYLMEDHFRTYSGWYCIAMFPLLFLPFWNHFILLTSLIREWSIYVGLMVVNATHLRVMVKKLYLNPASVVVLGCVGLQSWTSEGLS